MSARSESAHPNAIAAAIYARRKALANLMRSQALSEGNFARAVQQITETATELLDVERASVWRMVEDGAAIECVDLFERTPGRHSSGVVIRAADVPRYFEALQEERSLTAHDARRDPRTSDFTAGYLDPNGITAMLDAPVFVRGQMVGVVCHEHTGSARAWEFAEELLAGTFADFVALVIETADWQRADEALRAERDALELRVFERTAALQDSEASIRALLDFSPVAMVLTRTTDHRVVYANKRAATMFGVRLADIVGQSAPDYWVVQSDREQFVASLMREGRVDDLEVQLRKKNGRVFWARTSAQRLRFAGEDTLLGAMVDITDQKLAQARLHELATHDVLTGLFNRRHLEDVLRSEVDRALRYERPLAIAMLDADHFKRINDSHGHATGDEVLRTLAERCQNSLRATDVLGRFGGEEFVVVFPETTLEEAKVVAERVRSEIARPMRAGDHDLAITVSIGLACVNGSDRPSDLIARADAALYAAKQGGRNRIATLEHAQDEVHR